MQNVWEGKAVSIGVSPRAIEKAPRLFNATLTDIINELLQNSRRAGTTSVEITTVKEGDEYYAEFADDGSGIFRDDVAISLGGGSWEDDVQEAEDPAGMGIFSLAMRGAVIESAGWRLSLSKEHFSGKRDAVVERSDHTHGTRIRFPLYPKEWSKAFAFDVEQCARYFPLPVFFNGQEIARSNLLEDAIYVEEWRGLRIGVAPVQGGLINFYGLVVREKLPALSVRGELHLEIDIDVIKAPDLLLVLPARKEAVKNEFFAELQDECFRVIYRYIKSQSSHSLPYESWLHAKNLGITLPEALPRLSRYQPMTADKEPYKYEWYEGREDVGYNSLIVEEPAHPAESQMLQRSWTYSEMTGDLFQSEPSFNGYSWYKDLRVVNYDGIEIEKDGITYSEKDYPVEAEGRRADSIRVCVRIRYATGIEALLKLETDLALIGTYLSYIDDLSEVEIVVRKNTELDVSYLAEILEDAYFEPIDDDVEADSVETQRERFVEAALVKASEVLLSSEEALRRRISLVVERELRWIVPKDRIATVVVDGGEASVELREKQA